MPREGHISFQDLNIKQGYSTTPGSLFLYTKEENEFREKFREYVAKNITPNVERIERENNADLVRDVLRGLAKEGYMSIAFPKEIGGGGRGLVYRTIIGEELTAANYAVAVTLGASAALYSMPIIRFGTHVQQEKYLKPIMTGEGLGAIGITEPTGGSDAVGGMKTSARLEGDSYIINGEKRFITNGSRADYILLYAITDPKVKPRHGMSAFIFPTKTKGFEVAKDYELMGRRGSVNSHLKFSNCAIPKENLLGKEGGGFDVLMHGLDGERVFAASQYLGTGRSAFEVAAKYSGERVQFGEPIRSFEGISFKIAEMYAKIEAGRLLILRAARMIDAGLRASKEAAAAKFLASDMAMKICVDALQVVGGIGYTKEYPLERYMRDVKVGQIAAGSSEILRFLVQREIYKELGY